MRKVYVKVGETVEKEMPYSEVMMHMKLAGKRMECHLTDSGMMVQLTRQGRNYSFPVTPGEAGFYLDANGYYYVSDYCETCQVPEHDVCSLTVGCPCCDETMEAGN